MKNNNMKKPYTAPYAETVMLYTVSIMMGTVIDKVGDDWADWGDDGFTDQMGNKQLGSWENIWGNME